MSASTEQLAQMRAVNTEVDAQPYDAIPSRDEGGDVWKDRPDGGTWVCRDYALLKAEKLQPLGFLPAAMTFIICWTETNERHGVLCVEIDGDDWILDSRMPDIYLRTQAPEPYRAEERQVPGTTDAVPLPADWFICRRLYT